MTCDALRQRMKEAEVWFDVGPGGPDDLRLIPRGSEPIPTDIREGAERYKPELLRIARKEPAPITPIRPEYVDPTTGEILASRALTDYGNAERMIDRHGPVLRYCHPFGKWLTYDGARWQIDNTADVMRRAKETVRSIYIEAAHAADSKELAKHAIKSEGDARIRAMISLAQSEKSVPVLPEDLDADPWLLNVMNGTIDLHTGVMRPHDRADLITKIAPVTYDPDATCPTFDAFLARVLPDEALRQFMWRAIGYALTGDTREDVIFIAYGSGNNGKSTLIEMLLALLGDYGMQTPTETLMTKREEGIPNDVARLKGARFVAAVEAEEGRRLAESRIKQMTGGDRINARFLHAEWFEFTPQFKIFLSTNHKPLIRGTDNGIWRRIRLIPFGVVIPEEERDESLPDKLRAELPGILNRAIAGCLEWRRDKLGVPAEVERATKTYREEMDILGNWLTECCVNGAKMQARAGDLFASYQHWCEGNGERAIAQRAFGLKLAERGYTSEKGTGGVRFWHGIGLVTVAQVADSGAFP